MIPAIGTTLLISLAGTPTQAITRSTPRTFTVTTPDVAPTSPEERPLLGTLTRRIADDFEHKSSRESTLVTIDGTSIPVAPALVDTLPSGATVKLTVRSTASGISAGGETREARVVDKLRNGRAQIMAIEPAAHRTAAAQAAGVPPVTMAGASRVPRDVVVVPVNLSGVAPPSAASIEAGVRESMRYWDRVTRGRITLGKVTVRPTLALPSPAQGPCSDDGSSDLAGSVLKSLGKRGGPEQHVVVVHPYVQNCHSGMATMGTDEPFMWINGDVGVGTWAHEFGHNFGLGHSGLHKCRDANGPSAFGGSCSYVEYDDAWDVMGYSTILATTSPEHLRQLGVLDADEHLTVLGDTIVNLTPVSSQRGLLVARIVTGKGLFTVEYRQPTGQDSEIAQERTPIPDRPGWFYVNSRAGAGVVVRHMTPSEDYGVLDMHPETSVETDRALQAGQSWMAASVGVGVSVESADATSARVRITAPEAIPTISDDVSVALRVGAISGRQAPATLKWSPAPDTASLIRDQLVKIKGWRDAVLGPTARSTMISVSDRELAGSVTARNSRGEGEERRFTARVDYERFWSTNGSWTILPNRALVTGSSLTTTRPGASASLTTFASSIGLIATTGPGRGDAVVFLDGRKVATVNLSGSKVRTGQQVWVARVTPGRHTVRIVNAAPKGRASITVEGIATL